MTVTPLSYEERLNSGFTHKLVLPYTDFTGLTSGSTYSLFPTLNTSATFAAGTRIAAFAVRVSTAFVFSPGTLVIKIGDGGDDDRYFASTSVKTAAWVENTVGTKPYLYDAADTIDFVMTAGAGALSSITAGELTIFIAVQDLTVL